MLKIDNLEIGYDSSGWSRQISLTVNKGGICVLKGPSGSGKSTLLSTIAGFQAPLSGSLSWNDRDLLSLPPWDRPLTVLFQNGNLFEGLTVFQNIALGISPSGKVQAADKAHINVLIDRLGLTGLANRMPYQLSGGQQQRAALARAILRDKPVLLLDEPFTGLDDERRSDAITLISDMCKTQQFTVLLVSHDSRDAEALGATSYNFG